MATSTLGKIAGFVCACALVGIGTLWFSPWLGAAILATGAVAALVVFGSANR